MRCNIMVFMLLIMSWRSLPFQNQERRTLTLTDSSISDKSIDFEVSYLIENPTVPYIAKLPVEMKEDTALFLQGSLLAEAKDFEVNFKTGAFDEEIIAFHFNPRIGQYTALNSFQNRTWGAEESASDKPFTPGASFYMIVVIKSNCYEVYVNDQKHSTFNHRIPYSQISTINIRKDVSLNIMALIKSWRSSPFQILEKKTLTIAGSSVFKESIQFQVSYPVNNPVLPYKSKIPVELKEDIAFFFQGSVSADATEFRIDFKTESSSDDATAFHFNPRMGRYTAMNSYQNKAWGAEESVPFTPFTPGASFYMIVVIKSKCYEVYVNDQKHSTFNHRIPYSQVSTMYIYNNVSFSTIGLLESWRNSPFQILEKKTVTIPTSSVFKKSIEFQVSYPVNNLVVPYLGKLPVELKEDTALFFHGSLPAAAKRFRIDLKTGPSDDDATAFHFNPRMGQFTALNSFQNEAWGTQESAPDTPFTPGASFYMIVVIKPNCYEVYVNDQKHSTFNHRIPFNNVSTIYIYGNVSFSTVGLIESWRSSPFQILEKKTVTIPRSFVFEKSLEFQVSYPVNNLVLPYRGKIPVKVKEGTAFFFQGSVSANAKCFEVNFKTGPSGDDATAFHFSPCMGQFTSLNSFQNGEWETQESAPDTPFTTGVSFYMIVVIKSNCYEVYVNDQKHSTFNHRIPFNNVSTIYISGDVFFNTIGFLEN